MKGGGAAPALITAEEIAGAGAPSPCELPGNSPPTPASPGPCPSPARPAAIYSPSAAP